MSTDPDDLFGHELDPDWDAVPQELREHDRKPVRLVSPDGRVDDGVLVVVPGLFGAAKRLRDDDPEAA